MKSQVNESQLEKQIVDEFRKKGIAVEFGKGYLRVSDNHNYGKSYLKFYIQSKTEDHLVLHGLKDTKSPINDWVWEDYYDGGPCDLDTEKYEFPADLKGFVSTIERIFEGYTHHERFGSSVNMKKNTLTKLKKIAASLEKLAADNHVYLVSSQGKFSREKWFFGSSETKESEPEKVDNRVRLALRKAIIESLEGEDPSDYLDVDFVTKVKLKNVDDRGQAEYEIHCNKELSKEEMEALKDEWSGQLSDGWGEGFEQSEFYEYETTDYTYQFSYSPWTTDNKVTIKKA